MHPRHHLRAFLARPGLPTPAEIAQLARHLAKLNPDEAEALRREHRLPRPGPEHAGKVRKLAEHMRRRREAEFAWEEQKHPRIHGRFAHVAHALVQAHPDPGRGPDTPPGTFNPRMRAESPELQRAFEAQQEHTAAYQRYKTASDMHRLLAEEPPPLARQGKPEEPLKKKLARFQNAAYEVSSAAADVIHLGPAFHVHQRAVVAAHPEGEEALQAARQEAQHRYEEAVAHARKHLEALPEGEDKERAGRVLKKHMLPESGAGFADDSAPPAEFAPFLEQGFRAARHHSGKWVIGDQLHPEEVGLPLEGDEGVAPFAREDWVKEAGPRSNRKWRNTKSGKVKYSDYNPGGLDEADRKDLATKPVVARAEPMHAEHVQQSLEEHFPGQGLTHEHLAKLVGAPGGATVHVSKGYGHNAQGAINIDVEHPEINTMNRTLKRTPEGKLVLSNNMFFLKKNARSSGLGGKVFADQVRHAQAHGVDEIHTVAGRGHGMVGYKVWPRLGYNAKLSEYDKAHLRSRKDLPEHVKAAQDVQDLMETPEGKAYWDKHGDMRSMTFDLTPGSKSMKRLNAHLAKKGESPIEADAEHIKGLREKRQAALKDTADRQRHEAATAANARGEEAKARWQALPESEHEKHLARAHSYGLNPEEIRRTAEAIHEHDAREGGTHRLPPHEQAYHDAIWRAVANRHARRMAHPDMEPIHQHYAEQARSEGFDPAKVRREAESMPAYEADRYAGAHHAYRGALNWLRHQRGDAGFADEGHWITIGGTLGEDGKRHLAADAE